MEPTRYGLTARTMRIESSRRLRNPALLLCECASEVALAAQEQDQAQETGGFLVDDVRQDRHGGLVEHGATLTAPRSFGSGCTGSRGDKTAKQRLREV